MHRKGSETMSTSMTKGNPLKLMLQFALPLLIGNLLQQTYNIICGDRRTDSWGESAGKCGSKQQCTVSGSGILYGMLYRIRCTGCQVLWGRKDGYDEKLCI